MLSFKKLSHNKICVLLLCNIMTSVQAFDVKVLLQKFLITHEEQSEIELQSEHGFILSSHAALSSGSQYQGRTITVATHQGIVTLNGKPLKEKLVYISPMLSKANTVALKSYISCWLQSCRYDLDHVAQPLRTLFDTIVAVDNPPDSASYDELNVYVQEVVQLFLHDFLSTIDEQPAVTVETLTSYAQEFLNDRAKFLFFESLAAHHLTKQDQKRLKTDTLYRYDFFLTELQTVLQTLLYEFVPTLPRKLLSQILHEDVGSIEFKGNKYLGTFLLFQEKKQLYLINSLDIDDYLLSVIRHEGWPGWPLEWNKVFAIACRTYLVWHVLQAQKTNRAYHIENGIKHQTYKGHHVSPQIKQAIDETKDMFISYDGKPACTMYDSCCGGIVPAYIDDAGHKAVPYLARSYPCTFCKQFKIFNWHVDLSAEDIMKRLQKDFSKVTKIVDMSVYKKDRAGLVKKVLINVGSRKIIITEKKMKSLFPELNSYCFDITKHTNRRYTITGHGYGHHKGLCQWGAYKLVKYEHWNFAQVLQFYYPGTKLMKLTYQR